MNGPPSHEDVPRVLTMLGIDPADRIDPFDQDEEYTSCRVEEVDDYLRLYVDSSGDPQARAVLCCFLLQSLNDHLGTTRGTAHPLQNDAFAALFSTDAHKDELAYWMDPSDPDPANGWPLTAHLLAFERGAETTRGENHATRRAKS